MEKGWPEQKPPRKVTGVKLFPKMAKPQASTEGESTKDQIFGKRGENDENKWAALALKGTVGP